MNLAWAVVVRHHNAIVAVGEDECPLRSSSEVPGLDLGLPDGLLIIADVDSKGYCDHVLWLY
jgi:hypothetical protein